MRLLHLANWNSTNIGNGALIYGAERLLREDLPFPAEFVPEAWDDYTFKRKQFDQTFVDLVNRHDAFLINGAVTFNGFRRRNTHTGMRVNLPLPLWDKIEKPIIFYGISYLCWPFQVYSNTEAATEFLRYITRREDVFFGVRNDGTKQWIRDRFGVESDRIHEVPDPGLFVSAEEHDYPELHPTRKNILISVNGEAAPYRYATPFDRALFDIGKHLIDPARLGRGVAKIGQYRSERRRVVCALAKAAELIVAQQDVQFILVPHYLDDYGMIQEFIEVIQERIAHQRIISTGLLAVPHTGYFYGRYAKADVAISMRIHSISPSIGLGTPVIPVTSEDRMRTFLKRAGLSHIGLDSRDNDLATKLADRVLAILANSTPLVNDLREATDRMRAEARELNKRVATLLRR